MARVALEEPAAALSAVLLIPPADYAEEFNSPASRQEFEELLRRDPEPIFVSTPARWPRSFPGLPRGPARWTAYRNAGRHVADRCDVLIAVRDGEPARGPGGTAGRSWPTRWSGAPPHRSYPPRRASTVTVLSGRCAETPAAASPPPSADAADVDGARPPRGGVLFPCSCNKLRSPTAERVFRGTPGLEVRSPGSTPTPWCHSRGSSSSGPTWCWS